MHLNWQVNEAMQLPLDIVTPRAHARSVGDTESLLREWTGHFSKLAKSKVVTMPGLVELQGKVEVLASQSAENEEMLLDVPFSAEEVAIVN